VGHGFIPQMFRLHRRNTSYRGRFNMGQGQLLPQFAGKNIPPMTATPHEPDQRAFRLAEGSLQVHQDGPR